MPVRPEIVVRLPNSPGALAAVTQLLAERRVDVAAFSLDSHGHLRLVVDNHPRALSALRERRYAVQERDAIVASVAEGPGGLAQALTLLANAGVNAEYAYGSAARGTPGTVVIGVADALRAATAAGL